jgi:hypothetical protein
MREVGAVAVCAVRCSRRQLRCLLTMREVFVCRLKQRGRRVMLALKVAKNRRYISPHGEVRSEAEPRTARAPVCVDGNLSPAVIDKNNPVAGQVLARLTAVFFSRFVHTCHPSRIIPSAACYRERVCTLEHPGKCGAGCVIRCSARNRPARTGPALLAPANGRWAGKGKGRNAGGRGQPCHIIKLRRYGPAPASRLPPQTRGAFFEMARAERQRGNGEA